MANFLSISPNQIKFFRSVCLVSAGHFCYFGFSICGVWSLQLQNSTIVKMIKWTNLSVYPSCLCLCSFCFWRKKIFNSRIRNCLLGHRKKIAKFLMRTCTCRSTFLYGYSTHICECTTIEHTYILYTIPINGREERRWHFAIN